jgi:hypothetical protein
LPPPVAGIETSWSIQFLVGRPLSNAGALLIIDELGYVPLSTTGAELLFEVFSSATSAAPPS